MFYNGLKLLAVTLLILYMFSITFYKIIIYQVFKQYNSISLNDSLEFLCIISSPIYTILLFIVLIVYQYIYKSNNIDNKIAIILFLVYYFISPYTFDNNVGISFKASMLNLNLQNGLLNIHPYIIYIAYSWIFIFIKKDLAKHKSFLSRSKNIINLTVMSYLVILGIILGAWWASQEFNWGGFWSWDPVELISLLVFFYTINILHKPNKMYRSLNITLYFIVVITIYFIMRLGIVSTIHSFIKNLNMPFYTYILFSILLILTLKKFYYNTKIYNFGVNSYIYSENVNIVYLYVLMWTLSAFLLLLVCVNLNITSKISFTLNTIYLSLLHSFLFIVLIKYLKLNINIYLFAFIIVTAMFTTTYLAIFYFLLFIVILNNKKQQQLHFFFFWIYMIYVYFFIQISGFFSSNAIEFKYNMVSDTYYNSATPYNFESNIFFKKKFYLTTCKAYSQHILSFNTLSNVISTYFVGVKNGQSYLVYNEEFTMLLIFVSLYFIIYHFKVFFMFNALFY